MTYQFHNSHNIRSVHFFGNLWERFNFSHYLNSICRTKTVIKKRKKMIFIIWKSNCEMYLQKNNQLWLCFFYLKTNFISIININWNHKTKSKWYLFFLLIIFWSLSKNISIFVGLRKSSRVKSLSKSRSDAWPSSVYHVHFFVSSWYQYALVKPLEKS